MAIWVSLLTLNFGKTSLLYLGTFLFILLMDYGSPPQSLILAVVVYKWQVFIHSLSYFQAWICLCFVERANIRSSKRKYVAAVMKS